MQIRNERGLTLVELLVVIVLIGLIMVVVGKNVLSSGDAAKAELNMVKMEKVKNYLGQYRLKYNTYPSKLDDLVKQSSDAKKSNRPFFALASEEDLLDVWGFPLVYRTENSGRSYTLKTLGSDGIEGGDGAKQDVEIGP
jgi:general secretion pathway protein G